MNPSLVVPEQPKFQLDNGTTIERGSSGVGIWVWVEGHPHWVAQNEILESLTRKAVRA